MTTCALDSSFKSVACFFYAKLFVLLSAVLPCKRDLNGNIPATIKVK